VNGTWAYQATSIPLRLASTGAVVTLPLLALDQVGDVALGGFLTSAALFPSIIAAPVVGAWLDRARRPRNLLLAASAVTAAAFLVSAQLGRVPLPLIFMALLAAGLATPIYMGGLSSFATDNVSEPRRAYAQDSLSYTLAAIGGPAVTAATLSITGSPRIAMTLLAILALVGCVASLKVRMAPRELRLESAGASIARGLKYIVQHRPIAIVTLAGALSQVGAGALSIAAVALAAERAGNEGTAAWIVAAFAVGGLVGALWTVARRRSSRSASWTMGAGFAATGLCTLIAAPALPLAVALIGIGLSGIFTGPSNAAMLLLRDQESIPSVRSQVFTMGAGLRATASAIGAALAGTAYALGATVLVTSMACIWVIAGSLLLAFPRKVRQQVQR
jgi:hypothetical protein